MKRSRTVPMALLVLTLTLGTSAARAQAQTPKIAVANAAKVFQEIQETKDLKQSMENKRKQLEGQQFEKSQKIKDLQALRDQLKSDAPQYAERNKDLLQASIDFQVWGQLQQADMQNEQKRQMMNIFLKITNTVEKVAAARGIDLVIAEQRPEFPENLDQMTVDQLRAVINSRNLLYHSEKIDISSEVIAEMDKDYKAGK